MAEVPEVRPTTPLVRPIGGQSPRFGVAHDLDLIQRGDPVAGQWATTTRPHHPGTWDNLRTWWACRELHPSDLWHRLMCRFDRHEFQGGRQIQVGGRFVTTERRCVWCNTSPV